MRRTIGWVAITLFMIVGTLAAQDASKPTTATPSPMMLDPAGIQWGPPPEMLEQKGATFAVVSGDPSQPGLFVVRLNMAAGYRIAPHWHPMDEHVTVLSGTFQVGMGEVFDRPVLQDVPAGGYVLLPAQMRHFARAKTAAIVQVHGGGPFVLKYVNPADDPSKRTFEASTSGKGR